MSTNIRVFVQWTEQTVFAGEDIECQITFKNIATRPAPPRITSSLHPQSANGFAPGGDGQRKGAPPSQSSQSRNGILSPRPQPPSRGHRSTLSLSAQGGRQKPGLGSWNGANGKPTNDTGAHKRSVSIISIGASEHAIDDTASHTGVLEGSRRTSRGHSRSASLQIIPRRQANGGPSSAPLNLRSSTQPSPLLSSWSPDPRISTSPERPGRRQAGVATAPNTPGLPVRPSLSKPGSGSIPQTFKFPATPSPPVDVKQIDSSALDDAKASGEKQHPSPRSTDPIPLIAEQVPSIARILSPSSISGTPRSSGEFYSLSNNSNETLVSEYAPHHPGRRPSSYASHTRRPSNLSPINNHRPPETLMMGYAQISGSFTVDGSLINQAQFEEVKRKGAVGGQGGGVVGVETNKRDSGLLGGFGWGKNATGWSNLGESIGGLLGGGELSSMKEMRGIASSRSIPLLSTPQSILFVDLRLAPGESKSFKYAFKLPRGLPPSHRGKAIKISYKLVIGTQRPGGAKEQQVKSVDIPFRILGSVNSYGELLGHDLMNPYIILRDQARVKTMDGQSDANLTPTRLRINTTPKTNESTLGDFLAYVDELVTKPRQNSSLGLLSPTEAPRSRGLSSIEEPTSAKEAIDMAIMRSNSATEHQQSANRFEIARSGKRVAVVMLARPAYRLGETLTVAIDFTDAEIPCYAIHASLETSEKVDNSIALRSEASILRVTKKTYASHSESALFARRAVFSPTIPVSATPEFITSSVSLDWRIRIEFVTPQLVNDDSGQGYADLLEEVSRDDRGIVLASAAGLDCESFEVAVPLRVYGALAGETEKDDDTSDGLVV